MIVTGLSGFMAEFSHQVLFANIVDVAATGRPHVIEGDGLEHSNAASMMSHVLNVDSVEILVQSSHCGCRIYCCMLSVVLVTEA